MFVSLLQESALTMSVTFANSTELTRHSQPARTNADPSVLIEIDAVAAPDTLSRLLEPLVVLQETPTSVECVVVNGGMMRVRIELAGDREIAERLVRKLDGAVVVSRVEIVSPTDVVSQAGVVDAATPGAPELRMLNA